MQAEKSLKESEELYRALVENIDLGIAIIDSDYRIIMANASHSRLLHKPLDKILGKNCFQEFEKRDTVCSYCPGTKAMASGEKAVAETVGIRDDGSRLEVRIQAFPYRTADGQIIGFIEVVEDITQHKQMEAALQQSEALYRSLFDNMLNGFAYCKMIYEGNRSVDFIYLNVNQAFETLTGLKDVTGKRVSEVIPGIIQSDAELLETYGRVALTGKPEKFEIYVEALRMHFSISVYSPAKEYFVAVFDVINERKALEEKLTTEARKWQNTFDSIGEAVCLLDKNYRILQCNQAMLDLAGKPISEISGRLCWEVLCKSGGPMINCPMERMLKTQSRETQTFFSADRWLHAMVDPILDEAGEVLGAVHIIADISQYKRAEAKIKDLNTLLRAVKEINEALLRIKSESELFRYTCNLLASIPYIRFTWIGLTEQDSFEIKPVAWAGIEEGYLSAIRVTWDDSPFGQGAVGTAIKTGQPALIEDITTDLRFLPWRQEAQQRGYASVMALPLVYEGVTLGALCVYAEKAHAFGKEEVEFLNQVAGDIAVGVRSLRLEQELVQSLIKFQIIVIQTVEAIASMAEMRDPYTAGHQRNVTRLACMLAEKMGLSNDRIEGIRVAGFLHDIGKIVVPVEILNKPGKLSEYEFNLIKSHSQAGYDILKQIDFPWPVAQIVLQHHERLNGSGYPAGLSAPDILLEAKILAVADVTEAMAAYRPYRPGLGVDKALEEMIGNKGVLYDPQAVEACIEVFTNDGFKF